MISAVKPAANLSTGVGQGGLKLLSAATQTVSVVPGRPHELTWKFSAAALDAGATLTFSAVPLSSQGSQGSTSTGTRSVEEAPALAVGDALQYVLPELPLQQPLLYCHVPLCNGGH